MRPQESRREGEASARLDGGACVRLCGESTARDHAVTLPWLLQAVVIFHSISGTSNHQSTSCLPSR